MRETIYTPKGIRYREYEVNESEEEKEERQKLAEEYRYSVCKQKKIIELSDTCGSVLDAGIEFEGKQYSIEVGDKTDIMAMATKIEDKIERINQMDLTDDEKIEKILSIPASWHANGEGCEVWSGVKFAEFASRVLEFVTYHKTYFGGLKNWVNSITVDSQEKMDEVNSIQYGDELPEEFLQSVNANLQAVKELSKVDV